MVEDKPYRDEKGRLLPGHPYAFKPGQVANPNGAKSLKHELRKVLLEVLKTADGTTEMTRLEILARRVCKWAAEETPAAQYTARQNVSVKALLELFAPAEKLHRHEINAVVGVGLTPAARTFQEKCRDMAAGNPDFSATDLRRLQDGIHVSDDDLGIENGNGQGEDEEKDD